MVFLICAEVHYPLNTCPVVPASIKKNHLPGGRQLSNIALKIPLCFFTFCRCAKRHYPANPWVKRLGNSFYDTSLTGSITTFKDHDHLCYLQKIFSIIPAYRIFCGSNFIQKTNKKPVSYLPTGLPF